MEILSVTLKNFKSHSDRHFTFQPGTNAICGENGAGKTSILEAIAWALFDYAGDYNKDDLIRNGASSAQVRVAFVSNLDGRTYEVQRCTNKGYTLYDPQINQRLTYTRIREEVLPWLRQQFGVSPGTDLSQLFSSTIGVPQGTFTADFLLTRERRKAIFDKILKVEEYQQTWKKLGELEKYARAQVDGLERDLARYDEELERVEDLQTRRAAKVEDIGQMRQELERVEAQVKQLQHEQAMLAELAERSHQLENQLQQGSAQLQTQTKTLERLQENLNQAKVTVAICTANREAYQQYQQADATLRELEQQRRTEQTLQTKRRSLENQVIQRQADYTKLTLQRDRLAQAAQEIAHLHPFAEQQQRLETAQQALNQQLQACLSIHKIIQQQDKQQVQLQTRSTELTQEIAHLRVLEVAVQEIPALETQQQRYQQQLSRLAVATQFEAELRQLLDVAKTTDSNFWAQVQQAETTLKELQQSVPVWNAALETILATLHSGVSGQRSLTVALESLLTDLAEPITAAQLERQLQSVQTKLQAARQQQAQVANLERLLIDQAHLANELRDLETQHAELQVQLAAEPALQAEQAQLAANLAQLDNPKGRIQLRQEELHQASAVDAQIETAEAALNHLKTAIAQLDQQLSEFATLNDAIHTQQALRDEHQAAYETYMKHRELANSRKSQLQQVKEVTQEREHLEHRQTTLTLERDRLRQTFDPAQFQAVQLAYQRANTQHLILSTQLPEKLNLLAELDHQLAHLAHLQTKRAATQTALDQKKKTERFIKFARKAYKEAGPRITERYIYSISREADKLFRELLNRLNVSLQWTRDYEILVQEGAHTRRFVNLSGGEQMCAALAVRLALLKVLADIDIAFFDEPTTNMDRPRREQLAGAIANIKTFRQLFVISHDDTFETITENIILVEREG